MKYGQVWAPIHMAGVIIRRDKNIDTWKDEDTDDMEGHKMTWKIKTQMTWKDEDTDVLVRMRTQMTWKDNYVKIYIEVSLLQAESPQ